MKRLLLTASASMALFAGSLVADPVITVLPSLSPNGYGSPSYAAWESNAIFALRNGLSEYGNSSLPTYYQQVSNITGNQILVTSFHSWMGQANPGAAFGPAFANELGNRLLFGVVIDGNGSQFSISQMSFEMHSTDSYDGLGWSYGAGAYNYNSGWVGARKGADGILGTADDIFITSGPNTQLVDALYGRGSGNGYWPACDPGSPCTAVEQQLELDEAAAYNSPDRYDFIGAYTLGDASGRASVGIAPVPEPFSIALLGTIVAGLAVKLRRKA